MQRDGAPAGEESQDWVSSLREVLAGVALEDRAAIAQLIVLHRQFPAWAVWLPCHGRPWTAVRAASSRAPGPGLPMVWVQGMTAEELASRMQGMNEQLASP
jgi:hypothetical protein